MLNAWLLTLLCSPAASFMAPSIAGRSLSPRAAIRMEEEKSDNFLAELPLPSIQTAAYAGIIFVTVKDLSVNPKITSWIESGGALGDIPAQSFVGAAILISYSLVQLAKFFGLGKTDYYDDLEGFDVASLSNQAAEWALASVVPTSSKDGDYELATFAGGCFWGTELHFQRIPGVIATCVGYTQGRVEKPSYGEVCGGTTGHTEGLQLLYDPSVVTYDKLCDTLLSTIDSTAMNRVGNDIGTQYRHGIYPHTDAQAEAAAGSIAREQARQDKKVVTEVRRAAVFWPAEKVHQRYLQKGGQSAEKEAKAAVRCYG